MAYTVKQLAKLSGVSVRTLHWYDKKGLLKPSYHGDNGYRYYEAKELLLLQQILFYRELGLNLNDIQSVLSQKDFDRSKALEHHKYRLIDEVKRKQLLIETIDKTLLHVRGAETMQDSELYYGFNNQFRKDEVYTGSVEGKPQAALEHFKKPEVSWNAQQWAKFKHEADELNKSIAALIDQHKTPESDEVQTLVAKHYALQENFFDLPFEAYTLLIEMYEQDTTTLKLMFEAYHTDMQKFICKAMRVYAEQEL